MKKNKALIIALTAVLALSFSSCGEKKEDEKETESSASIVVEEKKVETVSEAPVESAADSSEADTSEADTSSVEETTESVSETLPEPEEPADGSDEEQVRYTFAKAVKAMKENNYDDIITYTKAAYYMAEKGHPRPSKEYFDELNMSEILTPSNFNIADEKMNIHSTLTVITKMLMITAFPTRMMNMLKRHIW